MDTTRPPSRLYWPETPSEMEAHHVTPALAACFARGCTEAETIAVLADMLRSASRSFQEHMERCAQPLVFTLPETTAVRAAALAERKVCAKLARDFAATEDKSASAATTDGWRDEARAMAKAARMVADDIDARK